MIENIIVFALSTVMKAIILLLGLTLIVKEVYKCKVEPLLK